MARRRAAEKRTVQPDPRYGSLVFSKFINSLMWDGKKSVAESIFYGALDLIGTHQDGADMFYKALSNVKPSVEVRSRRVGGATYPVPIPVSPDRSQALAIRWIIDAARSRSDKTMIERLAAEIKSAVDEGGTAVKKRVDTHRMAAANQAFAHYRW
jgi:small subunit ribosomal protein S7